MICMKFFWFLGLILSVKLQNSTDYLDEFDQCGGFGFNSLLSCKPGLICYKQSEWYSQCRTNCTWSWLCNSISLKSSLNITNETNAIEEFSDDLNQTSVEIFPSEEISSHEISGSFFLLIV